MEEKEKIKNILRGNTSVFSYFVDTYQDMAVTIAYRICSNRQDAEDIVQDSFVKAFRNLHTFRQDSKFSTWFYRIVYNTAISHIQSFVYSVDYTDYGETEKLSGQDNILSEMEESDKKELINKALDSLPKDLSVLLTLFYLEENSIRDVIQITGLSESNVKVKLHRARKQLALALSSMRDFTY